MNNEEVIDILIEKLKSYKKEHSFETYRKETLIKDVIYFLGISIDRETFEYSNGYDNFIEMLKKTINNCSIEDNALKLNRYEFISS